MAGRAFAAKVFGVALLALGGVAASAGLAGVAAAPEACGSGDGHTTTVPTTTSTIMVYKPLPCVSGTSTASTSTPASPAVTTSLSPSVVVISGHGWGHGIGMGQWGAFGYAEHGWSYRRILAHYYPGTTIAPAAAATVRVLLAVKHRVTLVAPASWHVVDGAGTRVGLPAGKLVVSGSLELAGKTLVSPLTFEPPVNAQLELGRLPFRGRLIVVSNGSTLEVIDEVGLEAYLDGVVGAEVPGDWPEAALEAQAIAARSFALSRLDSVVTVGAYDLYADTGSQVYGGVDVESPAVTQAVTDTAGLVVLYQGKVATTYFSSSTGGRTASAAEGFGKAVPYLVSVPDPYDTLSPYHDWGPVLIDAARAGRALGLGGQLVGLETDAGASGRVESATAIGVSGRLTLSGAQVRDDLGLRSDWFSVGWLALSPPASPVPFGSGISISGVVRGVGRTVLEARTASSGWARVAAVVPDREGLFSIAVAPSSTTEYRLSAGSIRVARVEVRVEAVVDAVLEHDSVHGRVRPASAGGAVTLERQGGSRCIRAGAAPVAAGGRYVIPAQLTPGTYRVRYSPGHGLEPGASNAISVS